MQCYRPLPVSFERGERAWLYDARGTRYLDAIAGLAVCGLGHAHPRITRVLAEQAGRLLHVSNCFRIDAQQRLGERLCALSGLRKAFLCNSGTEANEAALKLARRRAVGQGNQQPVIVVAEHAFHGRTFGSLSASAGGKTHAFGPLLGGFLRVPYGSAEAIEAAARDEPRIAAVMLEPIQGEAGVIIPPQGYLRTVRELCDQHDWLMILDEVQTGLCRTGHWFGFQHEDARPDILTLAKALANGVPIGACLASERAGEFSPGEHGCTFGGNPLSACVALEVLDVLREQEMHRQAATRGAWMLAALKRELAGLAGVREVRGRGLMIGVELDRECRVLARRALERALLINVARERTIRLLPPLIINAEEAERITRIVASLVTEFVREGAEDRAAAALS